MHECFCCVYVKCTTCMSGALGDQKSVDPRNWSSRHFPCDFWEPGSPARMTSVPHCRVYSVLGGRGLHIKFQAAKGHISRPFLKKQSGLDIVGRAFNPSTQVELWVRGQPWGHLILAEAWRVPGQPCLYCHLQVSQVYIERLSLKKTQGPGLEREPRD